MKTLNRSVPFPAVLILFFLSGASALIYETVWVRQLTLSFGISIHALSAVLAAFMFGLSLGAAVLGRRARRVRNPLRLFAWFEIAVGAYAVLLYFILSVWLPQLVRVFHGALPDSAWVISLVRFAAAFALLVLPTTLMGGTLPILGQLVTGTANATGKQLGRLYGINTLGAVLGTALAGFFLLKHVGIFYTTLAAVALNLIVGLIALALSRHARPDRAYVPAPQPAEPHGTSPAPASRIVHLAVFLSGYAAIAFQIMWNRTLLLYTHNSTYAFSTILIVFLGGIALGSLAYARLPERWTSLRNLGCVQIALAAYVWWSIDLTGRLPDVLQLVTAVVGTDRWISAMTTMFVAVALVVFLPTVLMGVTFPMATALCTRSQADVGRRIGSVYALNTLGNILGSLFTGFVLIRALGLRDAFAVAIACNLLAGFFLLLYRSASPARALAAVLCTAAAVFAFRTTIQRDTFRSYYADKWPEILFYREEVTDTVMVVETPNVGREIRFSDGRGTAGTDTAPTNRLYGHVPMLLHPQARSVLSIGFGVGNTLSALAQHRPDELICVELSPGVLEAAAWFPTNRNVLDTPNLEIVIEDGRNYLLTCNRRFDVIQLEPPEIHTAGVVNLYTREFYELARERLNDDGIICQWLNIVLMPEREMKMLMRTFVDAFPESSLWCGSRWWDLLLIGSPRPVRVRPVDLQSRFRKPLVRADLAGIGINSPQQLLSFLVLCPSSLAEYVADVPPISDDWTYVDFSVPQSGEAGYGVFLYQTHQHVEPVESMTRIRDRLELLVRRDSAACLIDDSGMSADQVMRFIFDLDRETKSQVQLNRALLHRATGN